MEDDYDAPPDSIKSADMVRSVHEDDPFYDSNMLRAGHTDEIARITEEGWLLQTLMGHFEPMEYWGPKGQDGWDGWSISSEQKWYERLYRH